MFLFQQVFLQVILALSTYTPVIAELNVTKIREKFFAKATSLLNANIFVKSFEYLHRLPNFKDISKLTNIEERWIEQKLDHFNISNTVTWQMRYLMNNKYYENGGPIFIFVGGEWSIETKVITKGHFVDMAAEHKGIIYQTEHRYYGESKPTSDITRENLKYLHVKQALADLAHFMNYQRENTPGLSNSKVIMTGGSYAATMVIWFKKLYPQLLAGGWASSAPLLAELDYEEYKEICGRAILELGGEKCYNRIKKGIAELESMLEQERAAEVKAMMKLCDTFNEKNNLDLWTLFTTISNLFAGLIQYQRDTDVQDICKYLLKQDDDAVAIAKFFLFYSDEYCTDVSYEDTLNYYIDSTYRNGSGRQWFYQTCNEYGWYQSSASKKQPFGTKFPADFNINLCEDVYGETCTTSTNSAKIAQTNADFGGISVNVENIYKTHGDLDPWNAVGHTTEHGATIIPLSSHCTDFRSISNEDSYEMRASKEKLVKLVRQWLAD